MKRVESNGTIPSINENTKIDVRRWARRFDTDRAKTTAGHSAEVGAVANEALVDDSEEERRTMTTSEEEPVYSSPRKKQGASGQPPPAPPLPPPQSNGVRKAASTRVSVCSEDYSSESSGNGVVDHAVMRNNSMSPVRSMEHREHNFMPNNYRYHVPTLTKPTPPPLDKGKQKLSTVQLIPEEFYAAQAVGHRKHEDDSMTAGARCCFGFLILIAQILLNGVMALCLYWVIQYRSSDKGETFAWKNNPDLEFNLHPVLMIAGFIYFMGQAMLMYRTCRCCRRIWNKLLHTVFHILSIPCIAIGFIAVLDSHNLRTVDGNPAPIPNFYSLHSWIGLAAMGLFALQFMVGFFSFLLLLCCESATASFRASLVPIHSTFGISTFVLAVAAACAGLTEKAFFSLSLAYNKWVPYLFDPTFNKSTALAGLNNVGPAYDEKYFEESLVINVMGAALILLAVVIPLIVSYPKFRYRPQRIVTVTHDRYG